MIKEFKKWCQSKGYLKPDIQYVVGEWSLYNIVDCMDYNRLEKHIVDLGIKSRPDHIRIREIESSGFTSHGFYQSLEVKCASDKMDLIKKYIANMPICTKEEMECNERQSDRLLSTGITMVHNY